MGEQNIHDRQIDILPFSYFLQSIGLSLLCFVNLTFPSIMSFVNFQTHFQTFCSPAKDECDEEDGEEGGKWEQGES